MDGDGSNGRAKKDEHCSVNFLQRRKKAVRRMLKKCLDCQRRKVPTGEQFMAKLPEYRVPPDMREFNLFFLHQYSDNK